MRLFLSSYRNSNRPDELLRLVGSGRKTALISNAIDLGLEDPHRREASMADETIRLRSIGLEPHDIDLRDYFGTPEALRETLPSFPLVWVRGGNTFVLRRAMHLSGFDVIVKELLAQDALTYGGYSAGVCVLAPSLSGLETCDEPEPVPPGYPPDTIWEGLGLLPYAVVPHYRSDHHESAMMEDTVAHNIDHHIPFIALRDGEAIVIDDAGMKIVA
ncbi:MAG TPA: Type 1 glutamine amidotransferase-like domain-containing protein [Actinomycetota bacterium]|nr:Type 1 glutamine amidotransferase-like domain-containing protein [Actinomycetota bacterium]